MKTLLLILALTFSVGVFAGEGEDQVGCGGNGKELDGCTCIDQSLGEGKEIPAETGSTDDSQPKTDVNK